MRASRAPASRSSSHAGVEVDLVDRAESPMTGASAHNEGKLHLGYVYANDPTRRTARAMIAGALEFGPLLRAWVGDDLDDVRRGAPFYYVVHRDSLLDVGEVERHFADCHAIALELLEGLEPDYFGGDPRIPPLRLSPAEAAAHFDPATTTTPRWPCGASAASRASATPAGSGPTTSTASPPTPSGCPRRPARVSSSGSPRRSTASGSTRTTSTPPGPGGPRRSAFAWVVHCTEMLDEAMLCEASVEERRLLYDATLHRLTTARRAPEYLPASARTDAGRRQLLTDFISRLRATARPDLPRLLGTDWPRLRRATRRWRRAWEEPPA